MNNFRDAGSALFSWYSQESVRKPRYMMIDGRDGAIEGKDELQGWWCNDESDRAYPSTGE